MFTQFSLSINDRARGVMHEGVFVVPGLIYTPVHTIVELAHGWTPEFVLVYTVKPRLNDNTSAYVLLKQRHIVEDWRVDAYMTALTLVGWQFIESEVH